jgi:RES domain-containing protein
MAKGRGVGATRRRRLTRWYRLVLRSRTTHEEVLPSRAGRFHEDVPTEPTTYVADTIATAWREVAAHLGVVPANPAAFRLYRVTVRNVRLVDLSDPRERQRLQITAEELRADPPPARCQEIARALRQEGYHGLVYPSVRNPPAGRCAAVFLEHAHDRITIAPADTAWRQFIKREEK